MFIRRLFVSHKANCGRTRDCCREKRYPDVATSLRTWRDSVPARRTSIIAALLGVILATFLLPLIVFAQTGVTATPIATLNLRAGPGQPYAAIGTAPGGVTVPVEGRSADNQWALVRTASGRGWIAAW